MEFISYLDSFFFYLKDNLILVIISVSILLISYQIHKYLISDEPVMMNNKWGRNIPDSVLANQGEVQPQNLTGWFPILRTQDVKVNQLSGTHALGFDLLAFRSSTGKIHVMDAYCPHMGTYLPVGGKVLGESVRCPFHGWTFNGQGECTHVPGLDSKSLPKATIKTWITAEENGLIMIWYDSSGGQPDWYPEPFSHLEGLTYVTRIKLLIPGHFTDMLLNLGDIAHFETVHSSVNFFQPIPVLEDNFVTRFLKMFIKFDYKITGNGLPEKHKYSQHTQLNIVVLGKRIITTVHVDLTVVGPYLHYWVVTGDVLDFFGIKFASINSCIPAPGRKMCFTLRTYTNPGILPKLASCVYSFFECRNIERDGVIWSNKLMLKKPYYIKQEQDLVNIDRWVHQFYPKNKELIDQDIN